VAEVSDRDVDLRDEREAQSEIAIETVREVGAAKNVRWGRASPSR